MTFGPLPDRDRDRVDALVADRYLEDLLAATDHRALDAPADAALEPAVRDAVRVLRRSLVRVHPSFRFEERLAGRLAELAAGVVSRPATPGSDDGVVVPWRQPSTDAAAASPLDAGPARPAPAHPDQRDPLLPAILAGRLDPADRAVLEADSLLSGPRRPLIVGGAITSAAISLVGVAWVAWRAARPSARPPAGGAIGAAAGPITGNGIGGPA